MKADDFLTEAPIGSKIAGAARAAGKAVSKAASKVKSAVGPKGGPFWDVSTKGPKPSDAEYAQWKAANSPTNLKGQKTGTTVSSTVGKVEPYREPFKGDFAKAGPEYTMGTGYPEKQPKPTPKPATITTSDYSNLTKPAIKVSYGAPSGTQQPKAQQQTEPAAQTSSTSQPAATSQGTYGEPIEIGGEKIGPKDKRYADLAKSLGFTQAVAPTPAPATTAQQPAATPAPVQRQTTAGPRGKLSGQPPQPRSVDLNFNDALEALKDMKERLSPAQLAQLKQLMQ